MTRWTQIRIIFAATVAVGATIAQAQSRTANAQGSGNWNAIQWLYDPPFNNPPPNAPPFPDNNTPSFGTTYLANIADHTVTVVPLGGGNSIDVSGLNISVGGLLVWDGGAGTTLTLDAGTLNNGGVVDVNGGRFFFREDITLTGSGLFVMNGPGSTINAISGTTRRMFLESHTIRGEGFIGSGTSTPNITNNGGLISADVPGSTLTINIRNDITQTGGRLLATNGATLRLNSGLVNNAFGGTIEVQNGSLVQLNAIDVLGGVLKGAGSGSFQVLSGLASRFDSLEIAAGTHVVLDPNADVNLRNTITNNGTITLSPGAGTTLNVQAPTELAGTGRIILQGDSNGHGITFAAGQTLLIGAGQQIFGSGDIGLGGANPSVITNNGSIFADVQDRSIRFSGRLNNHGLISTGNGGTIQLGLSSGDSLNNAGGTIRANPGSRVTIGGSVEVTGGTLDSVGSGFIEASNGVALRNLTNSGRIVGLGGGAALRIDGPINNTGTIDMLGLGHLQLANNATLSGGGEVKLAPNATISRSGAGDRLLVNLDNRIAGTGTIGTGSISVDNRGVIDADVAGQLLRLHPISSGSFVNSGTMQATAGGILQLNAGTFHNVDSGVIVAWEGSRVQTSGNVFLHQQANAQVRADADAEIRVNTQGRIIGGRVSSALSTGRGGFDPSSAVLIGGTDARLEDLTLEARLLTSSGSGTLKNVLNRGEITINTGHNLTLEQSLTLDTSGVGGSLLIDGGGTTNVSASLLIRDAVTIRNGTGAPNAGVVALTGLTPGGARTAFIQGTGPNAVLTNEANIEGVGVIQGTTNTRLTLINQGAIIGNNPAGTLDVRPLTQVGGAFDLFNDGGNIIAADGGRVLVSGIVRNTGDIFADANSLLAFEGVDINNAGGTIRGGGGIVQLDDPTIAGANTIIRGGTLGGGNPTGKVSNPTSATLEGPMNINGRVVGEPGSTTTVRDAFSFSTAGRFELQPAAAGATMNISGGTTFNGAGVVAMLPATTGIGTAVITGATGSEPSLTVGAGFSIEGAGRIGGNGLALTNQGTIAAGIDTPPFGEGGAQVLEVANLGVINTGTLMAKSGHFLSLIGATINNTGGEIFAEDGGFVDLSGNTQVTAGRLNSSGTGAIRVTGLARLGLPIENAGRLQIVNGATAQVSSGTLTNQGTIHLNGLNVLTRIVFSSETEENLVLTGGGVIEMSDSPNNRMELSQPFVAIENRGHTIRGAGRISGLLNQSGGRTEATGTHPLILSPIAENFGTLSALGPGGLTLASFLPEIDNRGTISVASGSRLEVQGTRLENLGRLNVDGEVFAPEIVNDGTIRGSGTINGLLVNQFLMFLDGEDDSDTSTATLTINGNFQQVPVPGVDPLLSIKFDEIIQFAGGAGVTSDRLVVTGHADLAGGVEISFAEGFVGLPGDQSTVLSFGTRTGDLDVINNTGFAGLLFSKLYTPTSLSILLDGFPGDANLDGTVNIADFARLGANFNLPGNWLDGDFTGDGLVGIADFSLLAVNFNQSIPAAARGGAVPEPGSAVLVGLAGAALVRRRRAR